MLYGVVKLKVEKTKNGAVAGETTAEQRYREPRETDLETGDARTAQTKLKVS